jgi:hypothetical protein
MNGNKAYKNYGPKVSAADPHKIGLLDPDQGYYIFDTNFRTFPIFFEDHASSLPCTIKYENNVDISILNITKILL